MSLLLAGGCVERLLTDELPEANPDAVAGDPCELDSDCNETQTCFDGTCVGNGELRVSLSWSAVSDFDLHVITPSGIEISYLNPRDAGGELDVDDCVSGQCRDPGGTHVENVFFASEAARGRYSVWVENFDGRRGGDWEIEVAGDIEHDFSGSLPRAEGAQSDIMKFDW